MKQRCMFCHQIVELVHIHGHYQCPKCGINNLPCCDGDNCHTDFTKSEHNKDNKFGLDAENEK